MRLIGRPRALAALLFAAALAGAAPARALAEETQPPAPQPPVRISAESAEYFNAESLVVFSGKVVAVQGDSTLTAERMEVRFAQAAAPEGERPAGESAASSGQRVASITASQSVTFRQVDAGTGKERYATGERGVYDADRRLVTLTGSPRLWEGKNVIVGEQMDFFIDEKKVVVKGKVNLTVYPDDAKGGGKPR